MWWQTERGHGVMSYICRQDLEGLLHDEVPLALQLLAAQHLDTHTHTHCHVLVKSYFLWYLCQKIILVLLLYSILRKTRYV